MNRLKSLLPLVLLVTLGALGCARKAPPTERPEADASGSTTQTQGDAAKKDEGKGDQAQNNQNKQKAGASTLTMMTYNAGLLQVGPDADLVAAVAARAQALPQALEAVAQSKKIDVIALQEVWDDAHAEAISKQLSNIGFRSFRKQIRGGFGDGLLLLARNVDVVEPQFAEFKVEAGMDAMAQKGFGSAKLKNASGSLTFVWTHLQAVTTKAGVAASAAEEDANKGQVAEIAAYLMDPKRASQPIVIVGDLNFGPGYLQAHYDLLAPAKLTDAFQAVKPNSKEVTWDQNNPIVKMSALSGEQSSRIDHVLFRESATVSMKSRSAEIVMTEKSKAVLVKGQALPLSDHYGVVVTLELKPSP